MTNARNACELLGRRAFEAYGEAVGGKTYDGKPIPGWDAVTEAVREGWRTAAAAVVANLHGSQALRFAVRDIEPVKPSAVASELPEAVAGADDDTTTPHQFEVKP